jgi:hypothetical protein
MLRPYCTRGGGGGTETCTSGNLEQVYEFYRNRRKAEHTQKDANTWQFCNIMLYERWWYEDVYNEKGVVTMLQENTQKVCCRMRRIDRHLPIYCRITGSLLGLCVVYLFEIWCTSSLLPFQFHSFNRVFCDIIFQRNSPNPNTPSGTISIPQSLQSAPASYNFYRNSVLDIATRLWLYSQQILIRIVTNTRDLCLLQKVHIAYRIHPPSYSSEVRRPGCKADSKYGRGNDSAHLHLHSPTHLHGVHTNSVSFTPLHNSVIKGPITLRNNVRVTQTVHKHQLTTCSHLRMYCYRWKCPYITKFSSNMFRSLVGWSSGILLKTKITHTAG